MWTRKPSLFMLLKKKREEIWEKMAKLLLEKELEEVIESIHDIKSGSYSIKKWKFNFKQPKTVSNWAQT